MTDQVADRSAATDGAELTAALAGDPDAFCRLTDKYRRELHLHCYGTEYPRRGLFVEVVEPERLVWTESGITTTTTFVDLGDGRTEVRIHQTNVPEMYRSAEAQARFASSLDRFTTYLKTLS